jgi:hypothetical protein
VLTEIFQEFFVISRHKGVLIENLKANSKNGLLKTSLSVQSGAKRGEMGTKKPKRE